MLWLPKWLTTDEAPAEGVSRRTFLMVGAAAAVGAMLPAPDPVYMHTWEWGWGRNMTYNGIPLVINRDAPVGRGMYFVAHREVWVKYRELLAGEQPLGWVTAPPAPDINQPGTYAALTRRTW
jgi:hypothetical protein